MTTGLFEYEHSFQKYLTNLVNDYSKINDDPYKIQLYDILDEFEYSHAFRKLSDTDQYDVIQYTVNMIGYRIYSLEYCQNGDISSLVLAYDNHDS